MRDKKGNTGNYNTGNYNTGNWNTGDCNTGNGNTGNWNTGDCNTGNRNTGHCNAGNRNTGDCNTGNRNTGSCNAGSCNAGHGNIGSWNTGNYNIGYYNTGDCNTDEPTVRLFNRDSGLEFFGETHSKFRDIIYKLTEPFCEWVADISMTVEEKADNPTYKTTGGYLKVNESMRNSVEISKEDRKFLEALPNFDAKILLECTGIDLENEKVKIIIDGKEIWISKESAQALKDSFKS